MNDSEINLLSGYVELIEGKTKRKVYFDWALVNGDTDLEIRRNFVYSRTFTGNRNKDMRKRMEELEAQGRVRLISYTIERKLGRGCK